MSGRLLSETAARGYGTEATLGGGGKETDRQRHIAAIADTGDGYVVVQGWTARCLWCDWWATAPTKREVVALYHDHELEVVSP